jgi:CubicO group peptidase (beta-lactamase class C family)
VDYGYQWWIDPRIPGYAALGRQGQAIYVVPSLDLVVVFTGELPGAQPERGLMRDYIIPSCNGGNQT